jgi:PAS domain S-box-containing protein
VDSALDAVVTFDVHGRITGWNPQAERLLGFSAEEARGRDVVESLVPERDRERHRRGLARFRETGAAPFVNRRFEMMGLDREGREFPVELTVAALPSRETTEFSAFIRDLRERKRAEEERARFEAAMEKAKTMSAMGTLVAGVAHEVRNPLFGISSILDALAARSGEGGENTPYLGELHTQVERLSRLMADLLEYGKPPALERSPGPLAEVVEQAAGACSGLAQRSQVEILRRLGDLPTVRMDRGRLTQVFQNLIDNAIRHSPAGSVVEIEAARVAGDSVECTVRDSGPGFQPGDLGRLFEPFFTRRQGGTGLGLSIVQRIVEQHGGAVTAANHSEGGALFTVRLPLGENLSEAAPPSARE